MKAYEQRSIRKNRCGERFGKLVVVRYLGHIKKDAYWECRCECGGMKATRMRLLLAGLCKTCGQCPKPYGKNHPEWEGCGDLSSELWGIYRNGAKARGIEFGASIQHAWDLFQKQNGLCVFTGWPLKFNERSGDGLKNRTASLDRIDSASGYVEGNLQWVHRDVNKLKKNMSDARFIELCIAVSNHAQVTVTRVGVEVESYEYD